MKQRMEGAELLRRLQRQYPLDRACTAPFAFWKMKAIIEGGEAYCLPEWDSHYLIYRNHLLYHSSSDGACHIPLQELNALDAISLPASAYDPICDQLHGFEPHYGWGLRYDFGYAPSAREGRGYSAADFEFSSEGDYRLAAEIIGGKSGWMTATQVRRMTAFEAFDPSLWFFVRDEESGQRVAIAISAYSPEVRETDLDWIFVLPEWQGRGVGRILIGETIARCLAKSDVIRVGGTVEFYRRCGFVNDTQWVWVTKPGYQFACPRIQP